MTDRDKIAEIIRNARMLADPLSQVGYAEADALLANGVILPPCKVGDKVYCIEYVFGTVEKCRVYGFSFVNGKKQLLVDNGESKFVTTNWYPTKEEAEAKLKELGK